MTAPYTPQHNKLSERKNITLVDMVSTMLLNAELPNNLWGEALLTACHFIKWQAITKSERVLNYIKEIIYKRVSSKKLNISLYKVWNGRNPNLNYIKVWECIAIYKYFDPQRTKLELRGLKNVFSSYAIS